MMPPPSDNIKTTKPESSATDDERRRREVHFGNIQNIRVEQEGANDNNNHEDQQQKSQKGKAVSIKTDSSANKDAVAALIDKFTADSNNALNLKLVRSESDLNDPATTFHPTFTHQVFGDDQKIFGYSNLRIILYYTAGSLFTYLKVEYDEKFKPETATEPKLRSKRVFDVYHALTKETIFNDKTVLNHPFTENIDDLIKHIDEDFVPPGQLIHTYTVTDRETQAERTFEIYKGKFTDAKLRSYHSRLQTFVLWYIDAAWYLNTDDNKWEVYLIFEKYKKDTEKTRYAIVGYSTVYAFWAYPDSERIRISQFLILPPFQKQGHGSHMLQTIYNDAKTRNCIEVCVEDPSEDFTWVRDVTDLRNCIKGGYFTKNEKGVVEMTPELMKKIRDELKITKKQIRKCYEAYKLHTVDRSNEEQYKQYRLEVKRRLFRVHEEDLHFITDADERKKKLAEVYNAQEKYYAKLYAKAAIEA